MGIRILRLQGWLKVILRVQVNNENGNSRDQDRAKPWLSCRRAETTTTTRTGSCLFISNMYVIHDHMPIFQWESEFLGFTGDKSHVEVPGEQWERQPQGPGQGVVHFFQICMWYMFICKFFNGDMALVPLVTPEIRIPIEKLVNKLVSHAYLKKMNNSLSWSLGLPFSLFTWNLDMAFVTLVTSKFW